MWMWVMGEGQVGTKVVDIVFASHVVGSDHGGDDVWLFSDGVETFGEDDNFVTGYVVFLDCLANNFL